MRVFVAGASGAIGTRLVPQLIDRGHEVIGTSRSPGNAERVRALGAEPIALDLLDLARTVLPHGIAGRIKQPYRAPQAAPFFEGSPPKWVDELLSPEILRATGLFDETKVAGLVRRCRAGRASTSSPTTTTRRRTNRIPIPRSTSAGAIRRGKK